MEINRLKEISLLITEAEITKSLNGKYQVSFSFGAKEAVKHTITNHHDGSVREWRSVDMALGVIDVICPDIQSIKILKHLKHKE